MPSKPAGALATAARTVSRGSLLGGGEGKPSMASTVLAMASKATSSASGGASAAAASAKPPPPSAGGTAAPAPAAAPPPPAASKPSTSGTTAPTSSSSAATKPEATAVNSRRARHDSQGRFNYNLYNYLLLFMQCNSNMIES